MHYGEYSAVTPLYPSVADFCIVIYFLLLWIVIPIIPSMADSCLRTAAVARKHLLLLVFTLYTGMF